MSGVCGESGKRSPHQAERVERSDDPRVRDDRPTEGAGVKRQETMDALAYEEFRINVPTSETRGSFLFSQSRLLPFA